MERVRIPETLQYILFPLGTITPNENSVRSEMHWKPEITQIMLFRY